MTMRGLGLCFAAGLCAAVLASPLGGQPAWAAKDVTVLAKVNGDARMARCAPDGEWISSWVQQADGKFDLYAIDAKGTKLQVDSTKSPGGVTWIPIGDKQSIDKLFYSKATQGGPTKANHVTFYTYDPKTKSSTRLQQLDDALETYQIDPVAADDGSRVFCMTMDPSLSLPSFNVYFRDANGPGKVRSLTAKANLGAFYDLSADGNTLYWWLKDPASGNMNLIVWDMNTLRYSDAIEYPRAVDPAEAWALFKVDAPNRQAAISVYSDKDPTLQLCVYNFSNRQKPYAKGIHLGPGELVPYFDWKGRSGVLYAVVNYSSTKEYGIEEIDATTGQRTPIYRGRDSIDYVDYSPTKGAYYFTIVDNAGTSKVQTRFMRVTAAK